MGKKGSWFSAIKRVFTQNSKEKPANGSENKNAKEKKKGRGILRHGETKSFIPLFREPSSIEKILGEADKQKLLVRAPTPSEQPNTPPLLLARSASPRVAPPRVASPRASSPSAVSPRIARQRKEISYAYRPEPTLRNHHLSATKIQAAYRGYMARRSFRALRGLVRLQGVVRGSNVKRQTMNAMKQMQLLVRIQTQIQSRRIQLLENQALHHQAYNNEKDVESTLSKWTLGQTSEAGYHDEWDDSLLTKEQVEARLQRKVEAVIKRERAMAYAYSHQLWKPSPLSAQTPLVDNRSGGFPWWWNWLERQLPSENPLENQAVVKNVQRTHSRPTSGHKPSQRLQTSKFKLHDFGFDNHGTLTPRSSKSTLPVRTRQLHTPSRTPPASSSNVLIYSKPRASAADSTFDVPLKDDESLTSCPPFSVPNYMAPTVSAKAKGRATNNLKERFPGTPSNESKRRFSFPLTPNIGSFKWNKGSSKDTTSEKVLEKRVSLHSIGDLSVDSAISMPAAVGRKPFNRFV